jgi:hypothetical protein
VPHISSANAIQRTRFGKYLRIGSPGQSRTDDLPLTRRLLYTLSYWRLVGAQGIREERSYDPITKMARRANA